MNLAKIAAIAICLPFIREATARTGDLLSLKEGEEHWSVMRGETEIARYAKTLSKAGDASRVELVLTNNAASALPKQAEPTSTAMSHC